jgi:hypothetical protein
LADRRGVESAGYDCVPCFFFLLQKFNAVHNAPCVMGAALQPPVGSKYWATRSSGKSF